MKPPRDVGTMRVAEAHQLPDEAPGSLPKATAGCGCDRCEEAHAELLALSRIAVSMVTIVRTYPRGLTGSPMIKAVVTTPAGVNYFGFGHTDALAVLDALRGVK